MTITIDHYHSLISPWTFLGCARLREIAQRHGAKVRHRPISLARIFPQSGGVPLPKRAPQRQAYRLTELRRWSSFLDIPINLQPKYFPADEWPAAGMVIAAQESGQDAGGLDTAILRAVWVEERNIADRDTLKAIADENGFDGGALLAEADGDAIRGIYDQNSEEAMNAGVFGAPTYVLDGELFWGQDRLEFLDRALANRGGR
ncbi:MAG: 2-hydroxychromene-2-carboxylate isomerase [Rhodospirillales bacterium]|nr:2-hydroxychromene-2-carboxylate isomerase [Rhodospirillales bacterium]